MWSWGDPALLVQALGPQGSRVLLPCGSGDGALGLLAAGAREVVAVDPRPGALALAELKLAAARTLPEATLRCLFGLDAPGRRVFLYHYVRDGRQEGRGPPPPGLAEAARGWWDTHEELVRAGLHGAGGARERASTRLRTRLRQAGLGPAVGRSLSDGAPATWAGRRWRLALRLALGGPLGAEGATHVGRRLATLAPGGGRLAWLVLAGEPPPGQPPAPWMAPAALAALRGPGRLLPTSSTLSRALEEQPPASLDAVSLGLVRGSPESLLALAARALRPGGRLLLRVPEGALRAEPPAALVPDQALTRVLRARDGALVAGAPLLLRRR